VVLLHWWKHLVDAGAETQLIRVYLRDTVESL